MRNNYGKYDRDFDFWTTNRPANEIGPAELRIDVGNTGSGFKENNRTPDAEPTLVNRKHNGSLPLHSSIFNDLNPKRFTLADSILENPNSIPEGPIFKEIDSSEQVRDGSVTKLLLERGADVNQFDKNDFSPLMEITMVCVSLTDAKNEKSNTLAMTLLTLLVEKYQADVNLENKSHSTTALFDAVIAKNTEVVEYLIKHGANFKFVKKGADDLIPARPQGIMKLFIEYAAVEYMSETQLNHCFKDMIKDSGYAIPNYVLIKSFVEQCARFNRLSERFYPIHHILDREMDERNVDLIKFLLIKGSPCDAPAPPNGETCSTSAMRYIPGHKRAARKIRIDVSTYFDVIESLFKDKLDGTIFENYCQSIESWFKGDKEYLNLRTVNRYNTLLHAACEVDLTKSGYILNKVSNLPLQARIKILTAQNADKHTPLDILYKQLEALKQRKKAITAAIDIGKTSITGQAVVKMLATDEVIASEVIAESEVADLMEEDVFAEEGELALEAIESAAHKESKELKELLEELKSLEAKEKEINVVITLMCSLMQNLVDKSVMTARQMMKFSFKNESPLHNLPEDLNAKIFQFLSLEPSCNLATMPASKELIETAIQKAAESPAILKMSGELWEINKHKALTEMQNLDLAKSKEKIDSAEKVIKTRRFE